MPSEKAVRLDRYLANNTLFTRKEVKSLLKEGAVCVDGICERVASRKIVSGSVVELEGEPISHVGEIYLMMHKPVGYVCANRDDQHPVVFDLLEEQPLHSLHIVGRLDIDTTGLILLTSDGKWSHKITSPRSGCHKVYQVGLEQPLTKSMIKRLEEGVYLGEEKRRTLPAKLQLVDERTCFLIIQEGRYHQVKRMFASVENRVISLHRAQIGEIELDPALQPGDTRGLTRQEISSVI